MPGEVRDADFFAGWDEMVDLQRVSPEGTPSGDVPEKPSIYRILIPSLTSR
jgi:hypothetical protein